MRARRAHAKSHFGCTQCKDKRVKCDESRPNCSRCRKRGSGCTYAFIVFQNPGSASKQKHCAIEGPRAEESAFSIGTLNIVNETPDSVYQLSSMGESSRTGTGRDTLSGSLSPPTWLTPRECELHRYYMEVVCANTLSSCIYEGFSIWGASIRQHAPTQPFLYSGMMAISSFHIAITRETERSLQGLLSEALQHQNQAISQYRGLLRNLSKENLEPALAFAALIVITVFARQLALSKSSDATYDSVDEFINDTALFRGVSFLHRLGHHQRLEQRLTPFLRDRIINSKQSPHVGEPSVDNIQLGILENVCLTQQLDAEEMDDFPYFSVGSNHRNPLGPFPPGRAPSDMYAFVVKKLRLQMRRMAAHPGEAGYILIWPTVLPNSYTAALEKRRPLALLILAHWAAALHDIRHTWWIGDFGQRIVSAVEAQLAPEWQLYMQWPLDHVGMP